MGLLFKSVIRMNNTNPYSLSSFSPASEVTVMVKLTGSSDRTTNMWESAVIKWLILGRRDEG